MPYTISATNVPLCPVCGLGSTSRLAHTEIPFDQKTRAYALYLDGEFVGFAGMYHEAEVTLDARLAASATSLLTEHDTLPGDWVALTADGGRGEAYREAHVLAVTNNTLTVGYGSRTLPRDLWRTGRGFGGYTAQRREGVTVWRQRVTGSARAWVRRWTSVPEGHAP